MADGGKQLGVQGTIVLLEPDYLQSNFYLPRLRRAFPRASYMLVRTESDFQALITTHFSKSAPVAFVLEVLVSWSYEFDATTRRLVAHPDGKEFYDGGIRAWEWACDKFSHLQQVPVIFYTVLDKDDVPEAFPNRLPKTSRVKMIEKHARLSDLKAAIIAATAAESP